MKKLIGVIGVALFVVAVSAGAAVVQPVGAASQVLIPAAGFTPGANGTFFYSDITIINLTAHDQQVALQWLPEGATAGAPTTITIRARSGIRSANFVHDYLSQTGLGAITITGVTSAGMLDTSAVLYVSSRIWTPEPGTNGTTSQSFWAIPLDQINMPGAAIFSLGSLVNPSGYRVNVGIVNLSSNPQTFSVGIPSSSPVPAPVVLTIPGMSMQQIPVDISGTAAGNLPQVTVQNITSGSTASTNWTAYGSTVDNVTGDAWSEIAVAGTVSP